MDAVHNPELITRWPECNQDLLRSMLAAFDEKSATSGISLLPVFDQVASERLKLLDAECCPGFARRFRTARGFLAAVAS